MSPAFPQLDSPKTMLRDGPFFGEPVTGNSVGHALTDKAHIVFGKLGMGTSRSVAGISLLHDPTKHAERMELIAASGGCLQVFQPVIRLDSVKVVDHQPDRDGSVECLISNSVALEGFNGLSRPADSDNDISVLVASAADNLTPPTSISTEAGGRIPFVPKKFSPNFFHQSTPVFITVVN